MKHTSDDTYSNGDYEDTTTYTKVYDGTIYWNGSGWFDITLDTPFSYNGIDNLVIYYQNHHGVALPEEDKFNFYYTYDQYRAIYKGQDGSFPTSWGTMCAYPPDIRLHYTISGPMLQLTPTEKNYEDVDVMHPPHKHSPSKILEVENYLSALLVLVEQTVINSL
ncbi:MAG: hypothetical protein JW794_09670 [Candidatus Cloacimonetes bacterium]|nr:hypothetical protein [Candidatus Cloacimonadota bacterium]